MHGEAPTNQSVKHITAILKGVSSFDRELKKLNPVPEEGHRATSTEIIAASLVRNSRGYIEKIANQINGCYERGWFDACAVMCRRLIEMLIIEAYEKYNIADKIKDPRTGDFLFLKDLITCTLAEPKWNLSRNTKSALPRLKDIGDKSAHSRRFVANRQDIDPLKQDIRIVVQELLFLSSIK